MGRKSRQSGESEAGVLDEEGRHYFCITSAVIEFP